MLQKVWRSKRKKWWKQKKLWWEEKKNKKIRKNKVKKRKREKWERNKIKVKNNKYAPRIFLFHKFSCALMTNPYSNLPTMCNPITRTSLVPRDHPFATCTCPLI
jgi:hypothetical protein